MMALSSDFIASFDKLFYDLWVLLGWLYVICGFFWVSELRLLRVGPWCTRKRKSGFDAGACALLCSVLGDAGARHVTRPHGRVWLDEKFFAHVFREENLACTEY